MNGRAFFAAVLLAGCAPATASTPNASSPLEQRLGQNPDDRDANWQAGRAAEASGDLLRAEQYYLRAEALGAPPAQVMPAVLRVLVASHRYDEALDRCKKRLASQPDDRATRFVAAALLAATDRPKDAEQELSQLVRDKPDDAQAWLALGRLYRDGFNDRVRARPMFEKFLALAPADSQAAAVRFDLAEPAPAPVPASDGKATP